MLMSAESLREQMRQDRETGHEGILSAQIPETLRGVIQALADANGTTVSQVARWALTDYAMAAVSPHLQARRELLRQMFAIQSTDDDAEGSEDWYDDQPQLTRELERAVRLGDGESAKRERAVLRELLAAGFYRGRAPVEVVPTQDGLRELVRAVVAEMREQGKL
jgi:hypothetical protein